MSKAIDQKTCNHIFKRQPIVEMTSDYTDCFQCIYCNAIKLRKVKVIKEIILYEKDFIKQEQINAYVAIEP